MWCAQIGHESVGLKYMEEIASDASISVGVFLCPQGGNRNPPRTGIIDYKSAPRQVLPTQTEG